MEINDHHIGWAIYWDIVFLAKKNSRLVGFKPISSILPGYSWTKLSEALKN